MLQRIFKGRAPIGALSTVVEITNAVRPPKRTLVEQAGKGRVLPPSGFFCLSEARLRSPTVFRQISVRLLAKRCVRVVGVLHYVKDSVFYVVEGAPYYFIG